MKKLSFLTLLLCISLPLTAAENGAQSSCWERVKNYVAALGSKSSVDNADQESRRSQDQRTSNDVYDVERTRGDYSLITTLALINTFNAKIYSAIADEMLGVMQHGACFNMYLEDKGFANVGRINTKNLLTLNPHLQTVLRQVLKIVADERLNLKKSEKELIFHLIEHNLHIATPEQQKVLKKVRTKLHLLSASAFKNELIIPLVSEGIKDGIQYAGSDATVKMTGIDALSPFGDTIAWALRQQMYGYSYKHKKFKITPRTLIESLLTDACYALAKNKLDEKLSRSFGFRCRYPLNSKSSSIHYLAAEIVDGYARSTIKNLLQTYVIKPCVSTVFGKPSTKKRVEKAMQQAKTLCGNKRGPHNNYI